MSLKYAIFKICPKLARKLYSCETSVYSIISGDSWQQKVVSIFKFGRWKSNFFAPQITKIGNFLAQKIGLWTPKSENGHHFLSPAIPKIGGSLIKTQNQKPMVLMVSRCPKILKIGIWAPYSQRQQDFEGRLTKKGFFILRNTLICNAMCTLQHQGLCWEHSVPQSFSSRSYKTHVQSMHSLLNLYVSLQTLKKLVQKVEEGPIQ